VAGWHTIAPRLYDPHLGGKNMSHTPLLIVDLIVFQANTAVCVCFFNTTIFAQMPSTCMIP